MLVFIVFVFFSSKPKFFDDGPSAMTDSRAMDDSSTIIQLFQKANKRVLRLFDAKQYDANNEDVSVGFCKKNPMHPMMRKLYNYSCLFLGKSYIWY